MAKEQTKAEFDADMDRWQKRRDAKDRKEAAEHLKQALIDERALWERIARRAARALEAIKMGEPDSREQRRELAERIRHEAGQITCEISCIATAEKKCQKPVKADAK